MSLELLNTSAPRGVRPGATGFCTVGMTVGVSPTLEERLTLLSGYRWLVPPGEAGAEKNPVAWGHWRLMVGGRTLSILSRICDAGFDYSRRSNRFAHHVVLEPAEQSEPGPAWVMLQPGVMRTSWVGEPMVFEEGPDIPTGSSSPRICRAWETACGDAGWAGVLAESFVDHPSRACSIIFPRGMEMLALIDEAIALLPAALRWQVTFSTYFTDLPAGMTCAWRCCATGTRAADDALRQAAGTIIDLTQTLAAAADSPYVELARSGVARAHAPPSAARRSGLLPEYSPPDYYDIDAPIGAGSDADTDSFDSTVLATLSVDGGERAAGDADSGAAGASSFTVESTIASETHFDPHDRAGDQAADQPPARPVARLPAGSAPRRSRRLFWMVALGWPVLVGGGVAAYLYWRDSITQPSVPTTTLLSQDPPQPPPNPAPATLNAADYVPLALHQATTQTLLAAQHQLHDRQHSIAELRANVDEIQKQLAAANLRAESGAAFQAELQKLKVDYAAAQARLAAATRPTTAPADRIVEVFRDQIEVWSGDGNGPPDAVELDSYKPPDGLGVDRELSQIVLKLMPPAPAPEGARPMELAAIKIDGTRVVLDWITANRGQVSSAIHAWLQLSRLVVKRHGQPVGVVRFIPLHNAEITVDHENSPSLLPEVRWKEAVQHLALAAPAMPPGWSATQKGGQTVRISSLHVPDAAFDVKLVITAASDVQVQTTYSATYRNLLRIAQDKSAVTGKKAAVERIANKIKELADESGIKAKDAAKQPELDTARHELETAAAAQRDAENVQRAAAAAVAELPAFPPLNLQIVNPENGLVLCNLRIKRGQ